MASAAELTRIVDKLEERVSIYIKFFAGCVVVATGWLTWCTLQLYEIKGGLALLTIPQKIEQQVKEPSSRENLAKTKKLIATAEEHSIAIPPQLVESAGKKYIEAAKNQSEAWPVALDLVSYRSRFNADLLQVATAQQIATTPTSDLLTKFDVAFVPGLPLPKGSVGGEVPIDRAASVHPLDLPSPDQGKKSGGEVFLLEGGAISLDGMYMRNVVLRGTTVVYQGGPVVLSNVIFVNCTFTFDNKTATRTLAEAVVSGSVTTLKVG